MTQYQVLARKYRPQNFSQVLGQDAIVTTLKNAIKLGRLAHAYLFCGSRGTGKTTLARVFAKTLNCQNILEDGEPCNKCSTCKEIVSGSSLDVLEIDGASNRGIDDIRQINETVGYASSSGKYKIYIIDEVHMLTKEAFNALLKTLEEPPPKVIFIFATTEPHKVLPTILSRCQRFNLNRIPLSDITAKLKRIANEMQVLVDDEAINLIALRAEGGLRDAESLFDQIIAFHEGKITLETVNDVLGIMPKDTYFEIDSAGKEGKLFTAFEIAHRIFSEGKDVIQFIEGMTEHFRTLLLVKLSGKNAPFLSINENDLLRYENSAKLYSQEQCLTILDQLVEAQNQIRFYASTRIALEAILLKVMRTHQRLPIGYLVKHLSELEQKIEEASKEDLNFLSQENEKDFKTSEEKKTDDSNLKESKPQIINDIEISIPVSSQNQSELEPLKKKFSQEKISIEDSKIETPKVEIKQPSFIQQIPSQNTFIKEIKPLEKTFKSSITEDPTPSPQDLGIKLSTKSKPTVVPTPPAVSHPPKSTISLSREAMSRYDTLLQFSAVELEGTVKKK